MIKNKDSSDNFLVPRYRELIRRYCGVKDRHTPESINDIELIWSE